MWHEGIAGRGANEIASCLFKVLQLGSISKRHLNIWCDNCAGQNKNRMVLFVLMYLVAKCCYLKIALKFLVSGHSYMACDRDFGLIEKRKRVMKAMIPSELQDVVKSARIVKPFKVVNMESNDFFDISSHANDFISTTKLNISKASVIQIEAKNPSRIKIKTTFSDIAPWEEVQVLKKGRKASDIAALQLRKQSSHNRISEEKKKDLLGMMPYLEEKYHSFYRNLCSDRPTDMEQE